MLVLRKSSQRGSSDHGWLNSRFSFSFADYYDPQHMGFSKLRVINDDSIQPSKGFDTHGHRDMEIISYVLEGTIAHKDSQGNIETLPAGEFQLMSAGSGISHSEHNPSSTDVLKLLQIWIEPKVKGQKPGYQQKNFGQDEGLIHIISPDGINGTLQIKQDMHLHQLILSSGKQTHLTSDLPNQYVHLVSGLLQVNGVVMAPGDGLKITDEDELVFTSTGEELVKALVFELP
ncbi:pirin family protein [uncultured Paraglaciecola sp.]|uniref:pirin family protein n=1 Tax=uncultured Paraglaciecola sp. TaxID=1765024 RepID=UPI0030DA5773|tara:strand:+ start:27722 stop:28414 length:693 start_codon:yes stop_codon:yes gene_type:complete